MRDINLSNSDSLSGSNFGASLVPGAGIPILVDLVGMCGVWKGSCNVSSSSSSGGEVALCVGTEAVLDNILRGAL